VSVLKSAKLRSVVTKAVKDLKVGDKIFAALGDLHHHPSAITARFATVTGLPHSPSTEAFVEIAMSKTSKHDDRSIRATLHHTFPSCDGKVVQAQDIKPGQCLFTKHGRDVVRSAVPVPVKKGHVTYTIQVDDSFGSIAVGGVFTHAKSTSTAHEAHHGAALPGALSKEVAMHRPKNPFEKLAQPKPSKKVLTAPAPAAGPGKAKKLLKGEKGRLP
jgi:hypothetical protein